MEDSAKIFLSELLGEQVYVQMTDPNKHLLGVLASIDMNLNLVLENASFNTLSGLKLNSGDFIWKCGTRNGVDVIYNSQSK